MTARKTQPWRRWLVGDSVDRATQRWRAPQDAWVEVAWVYAQLGASASIGNRHPTLIIYDQDGGVVMTAQSPTALVANDSTDVTFTRGAGSTSGGAVGYQYVAIGAGDMLVGPGWSIEIDSNAAIFTDTWYRFTVVGRELII